jgi:N-methylhydantoinase B
VLITADGERELPSKTTVRIDAGDIVSVRTPGGGGYGPPSDPST